MTVITSECPSTLIEQCSLGAPFSLRPRQYFLSQPPQISVPPYSFGQPMASSSFPLSQKKMVAVSCSFLPFALSCIWSSPPLTLISTRRDFFFPLKVRIFLSTSKSRGAPGLLFFGYLQNVASSPSSAQ